MHYLHTIDDERRRECEEKYGKEVMELYGWVSDKLDDEIIKLLYQ